MGWNEDAAKTNVQALVRNMHASSYKISLIWRNSAWYILQTAIHKHKTHPLHAVCPPYLLKTYQPHPHHALLPSSPHLISPTLLLPTIQRKPLLQLLRTSRQLLPHLPTISLICLASPLSRILMTPMPLSAFLIPTSSISIRVLVHRRLLSGIQLHAPCRNPVCDFAVIGHFVAGRWHGAKDLSGRIFVESGCS
jgi:hypothetical protein